MIKRIRNIIIVCTLIIMVVTGAIYFTRAWKFIAPARLKITSNFQLVFYENGNIFFGSLNGNRREGFGRYFWSEGEKLRYTGDWKIGVPHGKGTMYWRDGRQYEGDWFLGDMEGKGTMIMPDKSRLIGLWRDSRYLTEKENIRHRIHHRTLPGSN